MYATSFAPRMSLRSRTSWVWASLIESRCAYSPPRPQELLPCTSCSHESSSGEGQIRDESHDKYRMLRYDCCAPALCSLRGVAVYYRAMTVRLDADGAVYSDVDCFRCEFPGPHWAGRRGCSDVFACRRCFAVFADPTTHPTAGSLSSGIDVC